MSQIKTPVQVHFDPQVLESLIDLANRTKRSRAEVIRNAVDNYLAADQESRRKTRTGRRT